MSHISVLASPPSCLGDAGRRVDLDGECLVRVENLDEHRKRTGLGGVLAEYRPTVVFHEPAERFPRKRAVGNNADALGPVGNFPRFADRMASRQRFTVETLDVSPAPDPLFEDGLKKERVEHDGGAFAQAAAGCFSMKCPWARNFA
jgi:hypothetical protein